MNVHYTGRQVELSEAQRKKIDAKFGKVQKILGDRHALEAHVILSLQRGRYAAEVTLTFRHHTTVVECAGPDLLGAVQDAVDKLEKQVVRNKDRWREKKRRAGSGLAGEAEPASQERAPGRSARVNGGGASQRARVNAAPILHTSSPLAKPLTTEEAVLEMEQDDRDCVVYQDAHKRRLAVLFRRRDGNLELIES